MQWLDRDALLTYEEQARIARVCVERFGFESIRVTGGEPTVRAHLPRLFRMLAPLGVDLAMTTNGVRLPELAHDLAEAGLRRVNVSLDSLRRETFLALTRRDELDRVIAGHRRRARRRPRSREGQRGGHPGRQRRRGRRPRRVRARPRRRHALHRVHAARRDRRVDDGPGRAGARDPRPHRRRVPARAGRRGTVAVGTPWPRPRRARRTVPLRRRHRRRRRDRERDRAVLRELRPGADHCGGQVPHLPVRARGVRPAGDCCATAAPTTTSPARSRARSARSGPATGSARSTSCAPDAR